MMMTRTKTVAIFLSTSLLLASAFVPRSSPGFTTRVAPQISAARQRSQLFARDNEMQTLEATKTTTTTNAVNGDDSGEPEKELSQTENLMQQVKDAGLAGVISYALWELGFWTVSIPIVIFGYIEVTGHWPDLTDKTDLAKLGAEAFAFVNFARLAVPLRIGLALSTTPWIQENVVERFMKDKTDEEATDSEEAIAVIEELPNVEESHASQPKRGFLRRLFRRREE